jgi:hypothetical protein
MKRKPVKYADGGKVVAREYGKPSFAKSVAARASSTVSDGYKWFPRASLKNITRPAMSDGPVGTVRNAGRKGTMNRAAQEQLDET